MLLLFYIFLYSRLFAFNHYKTAITLVEYTGACSDPCSIASYLPSLECSGFETEALGEQYTEVRLASTLTAGS